MKASQRSGTTPLANQLNVCYAVSMTDEEGAAMQAEYEASQFTSCPQPLDFPTNPCYSDFMNKRNQMTTTELNSIVNDRCQAIEAKYGIECNAMMYEVAVHLNGNNNRATIYSPIQFINWADYALNSPELFA